MRSFQYIFISILLITSMGCLSIPFNAPPKPSGNFNIGTQSLELIDSNRLEWFTDNQNDLRKIMVQIWYPTKENKGQKELYIDNGNIRIKALADQFEYNPSLFKKLTDIETNSIKEAEPYNKNGSYPLIIFSHGLGGNRTQNTIMIEELVSNGYVVIAIEHAYDANVSIFDNGDIICGNINGIRDRIPDPHARVGMSIEREHFSEMLAPNGKIIAGDVRETVSLDADDVTVLNLVDNLKIKGRKIQIFGSKVSYDVYIELKQGGVIRFYDSGSAFDISDDAILKLENGKDFFLDELKKKKLIGFGGKDMTYDFLDSIGKDHNDGNSWSEKFSTFNMFKKK